MKIKRGDVVIAWCCGGPNALQICNCVNAKKRALFVIEFMKPKSSDEWPKIIIDKGTLIINELRPIVVLRS